MRAAFLPALARTAVAWKDGGGTTQEIAVHPQGAGFDFDWRVSVATVNASGAFSTFPGVDRQLVVLEGAMRLSFDGRPSVELDPSCGPFAFPGDLACRAEVIEPVQDLNVMVRRGGPTATLHRVATDIALSDGVDLLVALTAGFAGDIRLKRLDALRFEDGRGETAPFAGDGWQVVISAATHRGTGVLQRNKR
ncbi:HutD family protein [Caulobacter sp. S45]|uniref:HutD/Ves family protein n=1 Tax=Caulobacter sp. S45 TaxID=1641861 RepID=UPI00131DA19E|nr:HutD family protein [Caulobacter sp. S45]